MNSLKNVQWFKPSLGISLALCSILLLSSCIYMKMLPAPDADKNPMANNNSCYMATASNMLAGAGYGNGNSEQARTDDIYGDMITEFGIANGGWTDAAISWWLNSNNNNWPNNTYTVVTVYGNKSPKYPWSNSSGSMYIGNELRKCNMVGLSISWPTAGSTIGSGGHAITGWGDVSLQKDTDSPLLSNPIQVRVADSDRDTGGDIQSYQYDSYTNPNPGGDNEGNGWYIDFSNNHPYLKHIIVLSPIDDPSDNKLTQKVIGSYKIHQKGRIPATDLHYTVGTDVDILSYRTWIDWTDFETPDITENGNPRRSITVDWDLTSKPVPYCNWVTITTEFVLPNWNAISYKDVKFTYPRATAVVAGPELSWRVSTPTIRNASRIKDVTGGYLIGRFEVIDPRLAADSVIIGEYRFIHEYSFNQDPELHKFVITGSDNYMLKDFGFGHSYGYLTPEELWKFDEWMTEDSSTYRLGRTEIEFTINWDNRLPYPEGEYIRGIIPEKKKAVYLIAE